MANVLANIGRVPELRNRILFSLAMLAVYRVGVFVTVLLAAVGVFVVISAILSLFR